MLAPKRVKFRKRFKGRTSGMATRGNTVAFGHYGLMALEPGWISNRQIEASRGALTREMKRGGKAGIRLFPDKPITKKPAETRMGKGKGNPEGWGGQANARAGVVESDKRQKPGGFLLCRRFAPGFYGKQIGRTKKGAAHDERGGKLGDTVRIVEKPAMSKPKRWRVVEIVERA